MILEKERERDLIFASLQTFDISKINIQNILQFLRNTVAMILCRKRAPINIFNILQIETSSSPPLPPKTNKNYEDPSFIVSFKDHPWILGVSCFIRFINGVIGR